jgi:carbamoyl-phosphate synthase large subunit
MEIVYDDDDLARAWGALTQEGSLGREGGLSADRPVLVDRFLEDATEVDVDAIRDASGDVIIGGIMEHVEEAGVHSGDSACIIPPVTLGDGVIDVLSDATRRIATALDVKGLINVQFAVKRTGNHPDAAQVFVIEANPRASRTVPFVAKATGRPLVKIAARVMAGATLAELREDGLLGDVSSGDHYAVKEAVLPFNRFPEADPLPGPEMRSTGEVMGIDLTPGLAFAKAQLAAGDHLPTDGCVFLSLADRDKPAGMDVARGLVGLGFELMATGGTALALEEAGIAVTSRITKVADSDDGVEGPTAPELIADGDIGLVINTPRGRGPRADGHEIREAAGRHNVPLMTTVSAASAAVRGMSDQLAHPLRVRTLQEYQAGIDRDDLDRDDPARAESSDDDSNRGGEPGDRR